MVQGAQWGNVALYATEDPFIGAGTGATASLVHWLVKSRDAYLPAGTEIIMELSRPMATSGSSSGQ